MPSPATLQRLGAAVVRLREARRTVDRLKAKGYRGTALLLTAARERNDAEEEQAAALAAAEAEDAAHMGEEAARALHERDRKPGKVPKPLA